HHLVVAVILLDYEDHMLRHRHLSKPCEAREHQHGSDINKPLQFFENHKPPRSAIFPPCARTNACTRFRGNISFITLAQSLVHAHALLMTNGLTNDEILKACPEKEHHRLTGGCLDLSGRRAVLTQPDSIEIAAPAVASAAGSR